MSSEEVLKALGPYVQAVAAIVGGFISRHRHDAPRVKSSPQPKAGKRPKKNRSPSRKNRAA